MTLTELIKELERMRDIARENGFDNDIGVIFKWKVVAGQERGDEINTVNFEQSKFDRGTTADIMLRGTSDADEWPRYTKQDYQIQLLWICILGLAFVAIAGWMY